MELFLSSSWCRECCKDTSDTVRACRLPVRVAVEMVWARSRRGDPVRGRTSCTLSGRRSSSSPSSGIEGCGSPVLKSLRGFRRLQRRRMLPPRPIFSELVGEKISVSRWMEKPLRRRIILPTFFLSSCSVSLRASNSLLRLSLLAPEDLQQTQQHHLRGRPYSL